ncbi:MAG: hypothetical protein M3Y72_22820 [Acidobacteriota bacterium]|nr:hypothetical protein [Acidobacteriota bacterium]MDQ2843817.1 hypothetical protein [Acidobacteriota bacterium]
MRTTGAKQGTESVNVQEYTRRLFEQFPELKAAAPSFHAEALSELAKFGKFSEAINIDVFTRTVRLGDGVDVRSLPSSKSFAFVPTAYVPPKIKTSTSLIEYMYGSSNVASSLGGGTELEASLSTPKFSIGPKFKSSELQEQQSERVSGHLVVKFQPAYDFTDLGDESLNGDATKVLNDMGTLGFYGRYGTHFVGSVQPDSVYAAIFSFYFDTEISRQSFEQEMGLKLGIMSVFSANFSQDTKKALQKTGRQISFSFREFSASEAGVQPLPVPVAPAPGGASDPALDLLTPGKIIERYNHYVTTVPTATNVPVIRVKLRAFAELITPAVSTKIPTSLIELSASLLADIDDLLSDFNMMVQNPEVWKSVAPGLQTAADLSLSRDKLNGAVLDVLIDPTTKNVTSLTQGTIEAGQKASSFFKNGSWPKLTAIKLSSITKPTLPDTSVTVELKFRSDARLSKPLVTLYGNKPDASGVPTIPIELIKDDSEAAQDTTFWRSGPLKVTPVAPTTMRVESIDGVGRTREAVLFAGGDQSTAQIPSDRWTDMY